MISPERILAGIDGWSGASIQVLSGGFTNSTFKVIQNDRQGVLKIDRPDRGSALNSRAQEARIQSVAAEAGLAAPIIEFGDRYLFAEFLQGVVWNDTMLVASGALETSAVTLQRLHSLPLTGRVFDARSAANAYAEIADNLPDETITLCLKLIAEIGEPQDLRCCHNDLVAQNLISAPQLMFLDWEYACDNDPLFDLATIVEHHNLDDARASQILNAYFSRRGDDHRERLATYRGAYLGLLCLWLASRDSSCKADLSNVSQRLLTRYS